MNIFRKKKKSDQPESAETESVKIESAELEPEPESITMEPVADNKKSARQALLSQLLSPATGLAILGTAALIFSFYRGGQLANLVVPKDQLNQTKENSLFKNRPKIDINSQAVVDASDNSDAAMFLLSGDSKQGVNQALNDLTYNPPDYLPTIFEAGDILCQSSDDKQLGFGLLERAVSLAPGNQFITLRYCQRLMSDGHSEESEPKLKQLIDKYPTWPDPKIAVAKLHYLQNKIPQATTELIEITTTSKNLNSKQAEQVSLMLGKLGRVADGFVIFQNALTAAPKDSFYASYCQDLVNKNPGSYDTVLAMVKTNLAENKNSSSPNVSKQLSLEIKQAALLLLLGRAKDAQASLTSVVAANPKSFDLNVLEAASYVIMGQTDKGKASFIKAANCYQPKF